MDMMIASSLHLLLAFLAIHQDSMMVFKDGLKVSKHKLGIIIKPSRFNDAFYGLFDLNVKEKWDDIAMSRTMTFEF
jgi:hypothetical protein